MRISKSVCAISLSAAGLLLMTGCASLDLRLHKSAVEEGRPTGVTARLRKAEANVEVKFEVTSGKECGTLSAASANTNDDGAATVTFTGAREIEECKATIQAAAQGQTASTSLYVNKLPLTKVRIDGVSVLVLFLIASFAIDRIVRGGLFVLSFFTFWRKRVPDVADPLTDPAGARNQRLAYVAMAGVLAIFALGWIGKVRMLAALGFAQVDPLIDTLFTGLLLVGGADRTDTILQKFGAGGGGDAAKASSAPVEITGRVVFEDSHRAEKTGGDRVKAAPAGA